MTEFLNKYGITDSMFTSAVITIAVSVIAIIAGRKLKMVPSGVQNMIELGLEKLHNFFDGVMGEDLCRKYFPLVGTLFIYILICNYSGLLPFAGEAPGFQAPTSDVNFPAGMAIVVFFAVQIIGLREHHGIKAYKRFFTPFVFIFPLLFMDEFVKPISLTFRLYGNTFGDEQVIRVFSDLCPLLLPVIMQLLTVLLALVQALVFSLLAAIYISEACEKEHL